MISVINNKETVCTNIKQIIVRTVQLQLLRQNREVRYHYNIVLDDGTIQKWFSIFNQSYSYIINPRLVVFKNETTKLMDNMFFNFTQVQAIPEESNEVLYNGFSKLSEKEFFRILI